MTPEDEKPRGKARRQQDDVLARRLRANLRRRKAQARLRARTDDEQTTKGPEKPR